MVIRLINLVDAPLTRTDFVPVWYGFAMVFTGKGYTAWLCLSAVAWSSLE
jgi:hypothetical protein